jgi:hypothetical protein
MRAAIRQTLRNWVTSVQTKTNASGRKAGVRFLPLVPVFRERRRRAVVPPHSATRILLPPLALHPSVLPVSRPVFRRSEAMVLKRRIRRRNL